MFVTLISLFNFSKYIIQFNNTCTYSIFLLSVEDSDSLVVTTVIRFVGFMLLKKESSSLLVKRKLVNIDKI